MDSAFRMTAQSQKQSLSACDVRVGSIATVLPDLYQVRSTPSEPTCSGFRREGPQAEVPEVSTVASRPKQARQALQVHIRAQGGGQFLSYLRHLSLSSSSIAATSCPAVIHWLTVASMILLHRSKFREPSSLLAENSFHRAMISARYCSAVIFPSSNFLADSMLLSIMASKFKSEAGECCAITDSMAIERQIAALTASPREYGGQ